MSRREIAGRSRTMQSSGAIARQFPALIRARGYIASISSVPPRYKRRARDAFNAARGPENSARPYRIGGAGASNSPDGFTVRVTVAVRELYSTEFLPFRASGGLFIPYSRR